MRALQEDWGYASPSPAQKEALQRMSEQQYIGCDVHKEYSVFRIVEEKGRMGPAIRVKHERGELERFLGTVAEGSPVAVEACSGWMWMVGALEKAGLEPHLADRLRVKRMTPGSTRTDASDAAGLAMLLAAGTLPEVWMAPPQVRDLRSLVRTRLALRRQESAGKNRIHGVLNQYGLKTWVEEEDDVDVRDWFTVKAQGQLMKAIEALPEASAEAMRQQWQVVRMLERYVNSLELAIRARIGRLGWMRLVQTLPGVGPVLGATIWVEIGDVRRFPTAQHLARYAGLTPRVQSSGGKTWRGPTPNDCNHFLKWAYVEAANTIAGRQTKWAGKYVHAVSLYRRVKENTKLPAKAKVAVGRHLAEATWWMLTKKRDYCEPTSARVTSSDNG
jgi:transposase